MTVQEWRKKVHDAEMRHADRVRALQRLGFRVTVHANGTVTAVRK